MFSFLCFFFFFCSLAYKFVFNTFYTSFLLLLLIILCKYFRLLPLLSWLLLLLLLTPTYIQKLLLFSLLVSTMQISLQSQNIFFFFCNSNNNTKQRQNCRISGSRYALTFFSVFFSLYVPILSSIFLLILLLAQVVQASGTSIISCVLLFFIVNYASLFSLKPFVMKIAFHLNVSFILTFVFFAFFLG